MVWHERVRVLYITNAISETFINLFICFFIEKCQWWVGPEITIDYIAQQKALTLPYIRRIAERKKNKKKQR